VQVRACFQRCSGGDCVHELRSTISCLRSSRYLLERKQRLICCSLPPNRESQPHALSPACRTRLETGHQHDRRWKRCFDLLPDTAARSPDAIALTRAAANRTPGVDGASICPTRPASGIAAQDALIHLAALPCIALSADDQPRRRVSPRCTELCRMWIRADPHSPQLAAAAGIRACRRRHGIKKGPVKPGAPLTCQKQATTDPLQLWLCWWRA
jgi:hypothetical protein